MMNDELNVYPAPPPKTKFQVVGLISNVSFQKSRFLIEKLHKSYPQQYEEPNIRPMLNVDWQEYLTKMRRRHGRPFYLLKEPVAVFQDGEFIGDDKALTRLIMRNYIFEISADFFKIAHAELLNYLQDIIEKKKRSLVYFTIAIEDHVVGSLLFVLYNDLVPKTCENFVERCKTRSADGYKYKPLHRIVKDSWIQCGGWEMDSLDQPCENYVVPHNRRGVLSMCNAHKHADNTTQFFFTLNAQPWMDYKYVAFGQCVQGAEILTLLERVPTYHQNPVQKLLIVDCGVFSLCQQQDPRQSMRSISDLCTMNKFYASYDDAVDDMDSLINLHDLKLGKYYLQTDTQPYFPFLRYSGMFNIRDRLLSDAMQDVAEEEGDFAGAAAARPLVETIDLINSADPTGLNVVIDDSTNAKLRRISQTYGVHHIGMHVLI